MPKANVIQTNFTAGEFSPRMLGRVDVAKYPNAAKKMRNALPLVHGGVVRRFGTKYLGETGQSLDGNEKVRLIEYVLTRDDAFVLEFGSRYTGASGYMRGWKDDSIINYPITWQYGTFVYDGSAPSYLGYLPAASTTGSFTPGNNWNLSFRPASVTIVFSTIDTIACTLYVDDTLNNAIGSASFTTTGSQMSRTINLSFGIADIKDIRLVKPVSANNFWIESITFNGGTLAVQQLTTSLDDTKIDGMQYTQDETALFVTQPDATPVMIGVQPSNYEFSVQTMPFDPTWFEEGDKAAWSNGSLGNKTVGTGRAFSTVSSIFYATDVGRHIWETDGPGVAIITAYTSATLVTVDVLVEFSSNVVKGFTKQESPKTTCTPSATGPAGATVTLTLGAGNLLQVGDFVRINSGLCKVTGVTSSTVYSAKVIEVLSSTTAAQAGAWSQEKAIWYATGKYPGVITKHEQRLILSSSNEYPQTIWGSRPGASMDFTPGTNDDHAYSFSLASEHLNSIDHIVSTSNGMLALTFGGEFTIKGGVEKPITPTNIQVKQQSTLGCNGVRPVRIGNDVFFVQRSGRRVMSIGYHIENDAYQSVDMSLLSEHITEGGVVDMAYAQEPYSLLACALGNGKVAILTYLKEHDVAAWSLHDFGGIVESLAAVPAGEEDHIWMVVRRTINGTTKRYVERLDYSRKLDCSITGTAGSPTTGWSGLSHLEGETVDIIADGIYVGQKTVSSGSVTLDAAASEVEIGLPYTAQIQLLPVELQLNTTTQGRQVRTGKAFIKMLESIGGTIDGKPIDTNPWTTEFTGDKEVGLLGWDLNGGDITLEKAEPEPWHVLCVTRVVTVND